LDYNLLLKTGKTKKSHNIQANDTQLRPIDVDQTSSDFDNSGG